MAVTPPPSPRKRLRRHAAAAAALVLVLLLASPFVFTNQIVRYCLDRSAYKPYNPRFQSARFHLLGGLTLTDLTLDDVGENARKPLLQASTVRLDFSWTQLFSQRYRALDIENARLILRQHPGDPLRLPPAPSPNDTTIDRENPNAALARSLNAIAYDQVLISGTLQLENPGPLAKSLGLAPSAAIPFRSLLSGNPAARDLTAVLGETDSTAALTEPSLAARIKIRTPRTGDPQLVIETLAASNLSADLPRRLTALRFAPPRDYTAHADRIILVGTVTLASIPLLDATLDLRDCSLRSTDDGTAGPPIVLDRLAASTHLVGALTAEPLRDLAFSKTRITCDLAQYDAWRITHANAGLNLGPREIEIPDFEATTLDGTILGSGAYDLESNSLSRASLSLQGANLQRITARLAEARQQQIPLTLSGNVTARLSLRDASSDHLAAQIDILCPQQFKAGPTTSTLGALSPPADAIAAANLAITGTLDWTFGESPEITHGKITADTFAAALPDRRELGLNAKDVAASFELKKGVARLDDFRATVAEATLLSASARYDLAAWTPLQANLSINHLEGATLSQLLPGEFDIDGDFDLSADFSSDNGKKFTATISGSQQTGLRLPESIGGSIAVVGRPILAIRGSIPPAAPPQIDAVTLRGLTAIRIDGPALRYFLPDAVNRAPDDSLTGRLLDRFHDGIVASLGEFTFRGKIDRALANIDGDIAFNNLEAATGPQAQRPARLTGASFKAHLSPNLHLTTGEAAAEKIALENSTFTDLAASFTNNLTDISLSNLAFQFEDGKFTGNARILPDGALDRLHLQFTNLDQARPVANVAAPRLTAEGPTDGAIDLARNPALVNKLTGSITLTTDSDGKFAFAPDVVTNQLAGVTRATATDIAALGATLPRNFNEIVSGQLAAYSYTSGHSSFTDTTDGLQIHYDYTRTPLRPTDPGYSAHVTMGGHETSISIALNLKDNNLLLPDITVPELLTRALNLTDLLPPTPPPPPLPTYIPPTR